MTKLRNESADAAMLFVGDSTGNETTEWIYRTVQALAAAWPAWTVNYRLWNDTTLVYDTASVVSTGTGARTLTIWNCSVAGATSVYFQGAKFALCIASITADVTVLSLGHNEGSVPDLWHPQYVGFVEQIAAAVPGSSVVLIAQNPSTSYPYQAPRAEVYREIASHRGYGFIDVHQAFLDYGAWSTLLLDGVHPNPTGSALWRDTVMPAFAYQKGVMTRPQPPSTLTTAGAQLLSNGDFADFGGAIPTGWTASGAITATKDTTNYESPNGYALKLTPAAVGANIIQALPLGRTRGQWITMAARVYVPAGQLGTAGRIALVDSTGQTTTNGTIFGQGAYRWLVVNRRIPDAATYVRALLYGDSAVIGGTASFDQVVVTAGKFPRGAANGVRGLIGPAGVVAGQIDFMSTAGSNPSVFLTATGASTTFTLANQAILTEFRPFRNVIAANLAWFTGATISGNYDIGIYDTAGNRLWSKGSTPWPTALTRVYETVTPVALTAGVRYFIALAGDNNTAMFRGGAEGFTDQIKLINGDYLARSIPASFPLPATLAIANTRAARYPAISVHGT